MDERSDIKEGKKSSVKEHVRKKDKRKSKKRKHSSSSRGSDSDPSPKVKHKKKCKKKHKHAKDKKHKSPKGNNTEHGVNSIDDGSVIGPEIPNEILEKAQSMAPMSKEEWEKKQNTIRRVFDESTGRSRLVRGEGEIIEEIVSKERHQAINRQATQGDCDFFQSNLKKYI